MVPDPCHPWNPHQLLLPKILQFFNIPTYVPTAAGDASTPSSLLEEGHISSPQDSTQGWAQQRSTVHQLLLYSTYERNCTFNRSDGTGCTLDLFLLRRKVYNICQSQLSNRSYTTRSLNINFYSVLACRWPGYDCFFKLIYLSDLKCRLLFFLIKIFTLWPFLLLINICTLYDFKKAKLGERL